MKMLLPVRRHPAAWARDRLVEWVVMGGCQPRPSEEFAGAVVPEPILTWLETADDRVLGRSGVVAGMLAGGVVAAADMAALGTAAEMKPPAPHFQAFDATGSAGGDARVDR
jgi:hypothetical protein